MGATTTTAWGLHAFLWRHRGNEADSIRAFKEALGLSDEDAAPAHIDVGRRIMRSRFEASTRAGNTDSFRALQKLIYVSDLVFGVQKVSTPRRCTSMQCSQCSDHALASSICQGSEAHLEVQIQGCTTGISAQRRGTKG